MKRITVWNEMSLDLKQVSKDVLDAYPKGMQQAIADIFENDKEYSVTLATLDDADDGLSEELLSNTDVLFYWGHCKHAQVADETVERIVRHVNTGMGVILLHSAHHSKLFKRLCGTTCDLTWREVGEYERLWFASPSHPIAQGVENGFVIPHEEMYGEPFDIPEPDATVFIGWFEGGEAFRSGVVYNRGYGKVFYFQPGHETFPVYKQKEIMRILHNAADFVCPAVRRDSVGCPNRSEFMEKPKR